MSFIPVTNNEIPEHPMQLVRVILANYRQHTILARFAKNMTSPVTAYKKVIRG
jgi:hypothetical protein